MVDAKIEWVNLSNDMDEIHWLAEHLTLGGLGLFSILKPWEKSQQAADRLDTIIRVILSSSSRDWDCFDSV